MAKVVTGLRPGGRSERIQTAVHQAVKRTTKDFEQKPNYYSYDCSAGRGYTFNHLPSMG